MKVRTVRLYNPRTGGEANSSIAVQNTTVRLFSDEAATQEIAAKESGALTVAGTDSSSRRSSRGPCASTSAT